MRPAPLASAVASLALIAGMGVGVAIASGVKAPRGRFDDMLRIREGGVISVAPRSVDGLNSADPARAGWEAFRARHAGRWSVYFDERSGMPTLVSGDGIASYDGGNFDGASRVELETQIRAFLDDHKDLLGDWTRLLDLDTGASGELRKGHSQLVFRQSVEGVLVENARLDFHVVDEKLTMFGSSNWAVPTVSGVPTISEDDARDFLDAYLGVATAEFEQSGVTELVIIALDADPAFDRPRKWTGLRGAGLAHTLLWRLRFRDPDSPALWVGEIDAHDGSVRAFFDGAHYAAVRGGVYPEAPSVGCAAGGCEIDGFPMPYADWSENGQPAVVADAYGNLTCSDPGATFATSLNGPYAVVEDTCGPLLETAGCDEVLQLSVKAGENCDVEPGASPGNTAAARSAYYHINRVAEVARFYNPGNTYLNGRVAIRTNWDQTCNASYGNNAVYLYRSGTSWAECANSGEIQGIAVHEWGHGYDENDGGGWDNTSEAYADIVAMLASRGSCFGPGLFTDGRVCSGYGDSCLTCTGFRDHDWAARQANTPATPQDFVQNNCGSGTGPCGRSVHCETYPIGESIYDLAVRDLPAAGMDLDSAWQLVERLWYLTRQGSGGSIYTCALPESSSCAASSWYQRMRVADDDDGNLSNGTPHAAELYTAFARHNIACGESEDPENQSSSSCPVLAAPMLTIAESGSGPELAWSTVADAAAYVVYRGDLGCDRQQVPLATVPAGITSYLDSLPDPDLPRYYRVEAIGANAVCRSPVSSCESSPVGPRLQKNAHRMIEDGSNVNGNGSPDPGETIKLPVALFNGGSADALEVTARLRTVDPTHGRVVEPVAIYPDIAVGEEFESNVPYFELTLFDPGARCGDWIPLELEMYAADTAPRTKHFELPLGEKDRDFHKDDYVFIPRMTAEPVTSTLEVTGDRLIGELDVTVEIGHPDASELTVDVTSPGGTTVRLHEASTEPMAGGLYTRYDLETDPAGPGVMADFAGESILGTWTLSVQDTRWGANGQGTILGWTLHVTADGAFGCDVWTCPDPTPVTSVGGFVVDQAMDGGSGSADLVFSWDGNAGVAGYHVLYSTAAAFEGALDLIGRTDGTTTLTVEDGVATAPPLTFYQVRAVNGCNQESP